METTGPPKFLGDPNVRLRVLYDSDESADPDPVTLEAPLSEQPRGPCYGNDKDTRKKQPFEAHLHGFRTSCLRFVTFVTSCNARLASGRWSGVTGRAFHPQGHYQRFQIHIMSIFLLRQASWRNPIGC